MKKMDATWSNIDKQLERAQAFADEATFYAKKAATDISLIKDLMKIRKEYDDTNHVVKED